MTALELADILYEGTMCGDMEIEAAAMLRAQHTAIRTLREACEYTCDACRPFGFDRITEKAKAALAATEEF